MIIGCIVGRIWCIGRRRGVIRRGDVGLLRLEVLLRLINPPFGFRFVFVATVWTFVSWFPTAVAFSFDLGKQERHGFIAVLLVVIIASVVRIVVVAALAITTIGDIVMFMVAEYITGLTHGFRVLIILQRVLGAEACQETTIFALIGLFEK